ncbi:uncharacterized protein L201_003067 [Kwoniella dendrophila CBS 6074]|uniref:Aminoglycoside phosphotransferase domain-containing protein n=1 Tax=Kwoniella dendrophila CBS 6074 TaxID=1295534 RepID=A0AAX4JRU3_9TREE
MPELIEWPCDFPACQAIVLTSGAICELCYEVRCGTHDTQHNHECLTLDTQDLRWERKRENKRLYLGDLLETVRLHPHTITQQASQLHSNIPCKLALPDNADQLLESGLLAGFNVHFKIDFDDNTHWLLRVHQDERHRLPKEIRESNIKSEVTTLNILKDGNVPVPRAWLPPNFASNSGFEQELPFDYFFFEFISGETMRVSKHPFFSVSLSEDKLAQLIEGYANIQMELSELKLPVKQIGCLTSSPDQKSVVAGPFIARGSFQNPKPPYLLGPFNTMKDRYLAHIDAALNYIYVGAICWWAPVDAYLWHLELRELVTHSEILAEPLDAGDHLMWNDKGDVVGVLDWEWAYATSKGEAFASAYIFYDMVEYIRGDNSLTKEEKLLNDIYEKHDRKDLVECVKNGRLYQRLTRIGQYDRFYLKSGFREVFDSSNSIPNYDPPENDVDWRIYMMKRYIDNEELGNLMSKHDWSIERAEKEADKWYKEQEEKKKDTAEEEEKKQNEEGKKDDDNVKLDTEKE